MKIKVSEVKQAKTDMEMFTNLFHEIFWDIDEWIDNNKFVDQNNCDLKELFINAFYNIVRENRYTHDQFEFKKWCQIKFKFIIMDHRRAIIRLKIKHKRIIKEEAFCIDDNDIQFDFDYITSLLNKKSREIVFLLYYNAWSRKEIIEVMDISNMTYTYHIRKIRKVFAKYINGKL